MLLERSTWLDGSQPPWNGETRKRTDSPTKTRSRSTQIELICPHDIVETTRSHLRFLDRRTTSILILFITSKYYLRCIAIRPHIFLTSTCHLVLALGMSDLSDPLAHVHTPDVTERRNGRQSGRGNIDIGNFVQFFIPAWTVKFNHLQHDIVNPFTRSLASTVLLSFRRLLLYCFVFLCLLFLVKRVERVLRWW